MSSVVAAESTLTTADGVTLAMTDWISTTPARASVVIMHGLGEHAGRHHHVAQFFCAQGFAVRAYDHRGHGRSGGRRGDVPDDAALLTDAEAVLSDWTRKLGPGAAAPVLVGHSMGGLFAARLAVCGRVPLSGLILSSPALALPLSGAQKLLLNVLTVIAPGLAVPNGLKLDYLSHDAAVIDAYCRDPLVHAKITARLLNAMLAAISVTQRDAHKLTIPTLLVFAGDDRLVDSRGSDRFFRQLQLGVGAMHRYGQLYHEIFNEPDADQVFRHISAWLTTQSLQIRTRVDDANKTSVVKI